jgi:hypothetical protein
MHVEDAILSLDPGVDWPSSEKHRDFAGMHELACPKEVMASVSI